MKLVKGFGLIFIIEVFFIVVLCVYFLVVCRDVFLFLVLFMFGCLLVLGLFFFKIYDIILVGLLGVGLGFKMGVLLFIVVLILSILFMDMVWMLMIFCFIVLIVDDNIINI